jgi:hypothetical protein
VLEVVPEGVPDLSSKATLIYPGIHIGIGVYGYSGPLSPPSPLFRNEQVSGSSPLIGSMSYFVRPGRLRRPGLTFFTFRTAPHHLLEVALKSAREYSPVAARAPVR